MIANNEIYYKLYHAVHNNGVVTLDGYLGINVYPFTKACDSIMSYDKYMFQYTCAINGIDYKDGDILVGDFDIGINGITDLLVSKIDTTFIPDDMYGYPNSLNPLQLKHPRTFTSQFPIEMFKGYKDGDTLQLLLPMEIYEYNIYELRKRLEKVKDINIPINMVIPEIGRYDTVVNLILTIDQNKSTSITGRGYNMNMNTNTGGFKRIFNDLMDLYNKLNSEV